MNILLTLLSNREPWQTTLIFAAVIITAFLVYMLVKKYKEGGSHKNHAGKNDHDRSIKILKRILGAYIKRSDGRVIYSAEVKGKKTSGSADAILIGYFGVLVLIGCDLSGELYANEKDENLTQIIKKERKQHENPVIMALSAQKAVTELLREKKIYRVTVESAVIFTGKKSIPNISGPIKHYTGKTLGKALKSEKFLEDKGVNTDITAEALLGWRLTES